jgi:hypothetical protein
VKIVLGNGGRIWQRVWDRVALDGYVEAASYSRRLRPKLLWANWKGHLGAVEISIEGESDSFIFETQLMINNLTLKQLHSWLIEIQAKHECLESGLFQIVYRNRNHKHIPITDQFPADTDYTWNRPVVAQFHVVPNGQLAIVLEDNVVIPAWRFKAEIPTNQLQMNRKQGREAERTEIAERRKGIATFSNTIQYLEL